MKTHHLTLIIFLFTAICNAQTFRSLTELEQKHQACLDKGEDMSGCSKAHYKSVDSLMTVAYDNLIGKTKDENRQELMDVRKKWLQRREELFRNAYNETKEEGYEEGTKDFEMIYTDKKSHIMINFMRIMIKTTQ